MATKVRLYHMHGALSRYTPLRDRLEALKRKRAYSVPARTNIDYDFEDLKDDIYYYSLKRSKSDLEFYQCLTHGEPTFGYQTITFG